MPNPTVDQALDLCFDEVRKGAAPYVVEGAIFDTFRQRYRKPFAKQFEDPKAWRRNGAKVRRMAWWLGSITRFFAEAAGARVTTRDQVFEAAAIVKAHGGVWCLGVDTRP